MLRGSFDQKINDVKHKVLRMGAMVENIIDLAVTSLKEQNLKDAERVHFEDDKIDELELEIEQDCMQLLALQQPMAKDLRIIATALKIITDLERMGDHAVNISRVTLEIGKEHLIKPLIDIPKMAYLCQEMVKLSLDAFVKEDIELSEKVAKMDEEVDSIYETVLEEVMNLIVENKNFVKQGSKLLFVGRYLERIADHSTNICERTIYMVTGKLVEIN